MKAPANGYLIRLVIYLFFSLACSCRFSNCVSGCVWWPINKSLICLPIGLWLINLSISLINTEMPAHYPRTSAPQTKKRNITAFFITQRAVLSMGKIANSAEKPLPAPFFSLRISTRIAADSRPGYKILPIGSLCVVGVACARRAVFLRCFPEPFAGGPDHLGPVSWRPTTVK